MENWRKGLQPLKGEKFRVRTQFGVIDKDGKTYQFKETKEYTCHRNGHLGVKRGESKFTPEMFLQYFERIGFKKIKWSELKSGDIFALSNDPNVKQYRAIYTQAHKWASPNPRFEENGSYLEWIDKYDCWLVNHKGCSFCDLDGKSINGFSIDRRDGDLEFKYGEMKKENVMLIGYCPLCGQKLKKIRPWME